VRSGPPAGRPAAVAAPPRPAAPAPDAEENGAGWENLVPETEDAQARADTEPRSPTRPTAGRRRLSAVKPAVGRTRLVIALVVAAVVVLLGVVGLLAAILMGAFGTPPADTTPQKPPPAPQVLQVTSSGADGTYKRLADALNKVQANGHIQILDETIAESLTTDKWPRGISIEGKAPGGKPVVWHAPPNAPPDAAIFRFVAGGDGIRLSNVVFDGENRVDFPISFSGSCPGAGLDNVTVQGFNKWGVRLTGCYGTKDAPVLLKGLRVVTPAEKPVDAGILFGGNVKFIRLQDCRFEGPLTPLKKAEGGATLENVELVGKNVAVPPGGQETPVQLPP
jgi:hypothetical protein